MDAALSAGALTVDDLLNFSFDEDGEAKDDQNTRKAPPSSTPCAEGGDTHQGLASPEFVEEELEWLSNKDAFPSVETCLDILSEKSSIPVSKHSPVSVLDITINSNKSSSNGSMVTSCCGGRILVPVQFPMKARSKRQRRMCFPDPPTRQFMLWGQENAVKRQQSVMAPWGLSPKAGSRCSHCHAEKTPQWRAGPMGPKTLCNACGVRYKSGRLVPEYRPANSPTFSSLLHSNSHRKVLEMRKQKLSEGMVVNEPCAYRVG